MLKACIHSCRYTYYGFDVCICTCVLFILFSLLGCIFAMHCWFGGFASIICVLSYFGSTLARTFCSLRNLGLRFDLHANQANRSSLFLLRFLLKTRFIRILVFRPVFSFVFPFVFPFVLSFVLFLLSVPPSVLSSSRLFLPPTRDSYGCGYKLLQLVEFSVGKSDCYQSICLPHSFVLSLLVVVYYGS